MSQKTDTMIKLALVFTVCALSFSVGIYVGKIYSDSQYKLAQLEPQAHPAADSHEFATATDAHADKATATTPGKETALTDSEVAKIAEEFAADDNEITNTDEKIIATTTDEKPIHAIAAPAGHGAAAATNGAAAVAKPAVKVGASAAKANDPERTVASIPPKTDSSLHFTVQAGAFPTANEAQKLTKELQGKGFKTSAVPAQINGQTWYRVNVGLFGTFKEAQDYKKDFLQKTSLTSAFVQKVQ
ncbi:MAG: SPOR domain-containing protein [Bdellovibrionaceae bacterium]|nr:SPOR domain-containing protein [Bdellovibrio sp.]